MDKCRWVQMDKCRWVQMDKCCGCRWINADGADNGVDLRAKRMQGKGVQLMGQIQGQEQMEGRLCRKCDAYFSPAVVKGRGVKNMQSSFFGHCH